MSLLYEAWASSVAEIEGISDIYPGKHIYAVEHSADECIKSIVEQLFIESCLEGGWIGKSEIYKV
jgi:golgin subfamily B member 1